MIYRAVIVLNCTSRVIQLLTDFSHCNTSDKRSTLLNFWLMKAFSCQLYKCNDKYINRFFTTNNNNSIFGLNTSI